MRGAVAGRRSDFEVTVEVPKNAGLDSVLDQGLALLQSMASKTGVELHLTTSNTSYREGGQRGDKGHRPDASGRVVAGRVDGEGEHAPDRGDDLVRGEGSVAQMCCGPDR